MAREIPIAKRPETAQSVRIRDCDTFMCTRYPVVYDTSNTGCNWYHTAVLVAGTIQSRGLRKTCTRYQVCRVPDTWYQLPGTWYNSVNEYLLIACKRGGPVEDRCLMTPRYGCCLLLACAEFANSSNVMWRVRVPGS